MSKPWLILDCHFLCHRAFHATGHLEHEGTPTGVVFGFLKALKSFRDRFQSDKFVFCFDHPTKGLRETHYPWYKEKRRRNGMPEDLSYQISLLRNEILLDLGYRNIFKKQGLEADDVIALVCRQMKKDTAVIISADKDLYQLLNDRVHIFNPISQSTLSESGFKAMYGISPDVWATFKAIAGCSSDEIPGVKGVGEKTALLYLTNKLSANDPRKRKIDNDENWPEYLKLTKLPYKEDGSFGLVKNEFDKNQWDKWCAKLGFTTVDQPSSGKLLFKEKEGF